MKILLLSTTIAITLVFVFRYFYWIKMTNTFRFRSKSISPKIFDESLVENVSHDFELEETHNYKKKIGIKRYTYTGFTDKLPILTEQEKIYLNNH